MDGKSRDIKKEQLNKLKKLFPEAVTEGKVDMEMLKAALGEEINTDNERYVLNRAGKAETFRVLRQPTTATLAPNKIMEKADNLSQNTKKRLKLKSVIVDKGYCSLYNCKGIIDKIICSPLDLPQGLEWGYFFYRGNK